MKIGKKITYLKDLKDNLSSKKTEEGNRKGIKGRNKPKIFIFSSNILKNGL